ncbi:NACHT domain-containing protein, partial [Vibrio coralliilyticus]|uniref:NACHT domain-containing protein n=1 Tax=Vibrio coralliilyticus TaxID=190893 RepID=UPI000571ED70
KGMHFFHRVSNDILFDGYVSLIFDYSLFKIIIISYNQLPLNDIPLSNTSWSDKIWSVVFLGILWGFIYTIYSDWGSDGKVSVKDSKLKEVKKELGFIKAALRGMNPSKIEVKEADFDAEKRDGNNFELSFLDTPRDWPSEARELLNLFSSQYNIKKNEWFSEENCFLSRYLETNLLVICSKSAPDKEKIIKKINYFSSLLGDSSKKLNVIVAIKESISDSDIITIYDGNIKCYTKDFLLNNLINFDEYNDYLKDQFYKSEIYDGDEYTLDDVYVASSGMLTGINSKNDDTLIDNVESYLLEWAKSKKNEEQIALLGDYGQGKSVLSLKFANELINSPIDKQPIIIELRGKSPRNMPMEELVAAWAYRFNYNVTSILTLLKEGKLIVILEGFDELDMVGDKLRRLEHFKKLWEFARYKKSKVIITGRPNLFLNNEEARDYLNLQNKSASTFHVKAIKLEAFSREKIGLSLRNMPEKTSKEILYYYDQSGDNDGFSDLISRPSTLFQAGIIWDSLDKSNLNSSKIINSFIDHAYKRQAEKLLSISGSNLESPVLTPRERAYFMLGVAVGMVRYNGYSNQISGKELANIVRKLFFYIPEECSQDHHSSVKTLTQRLESDAFDSVFNDVRTSGVLVRDLTGHDSFKFAHKSFLESLFSSFFKYKIKPESKYEEIIFNTISSALSIDDIYSLEFSNEVISHITDNLINKGQDFGNNESRELLNLLSKKSIFIDKLFYKKYFGITLYTSFRIIFSFLLVLLFFFSESPEKLRTESWVILFLF